MKISVRTAGAGLLLYFFACGISWGRCSPIVIDLARDGVKLGKPGVGVLFDVNADGVSTANEMRSLRSYGITALEIIPKIRKRMDEAGNILPYWAWALQENRGGRAAMVDVYFQQLPK
jgi:hypothetical protein